MATELEECTREELNEKAHVLHEKATQMTECQSLVSSLREQCMQLRAAIKQLTEECARHPAPPVADEESQRGLLLRQRHLLVEIDVWRHQQTPGSVNKTEGERRRKLRKTVEELKVNLESVKEEKIAISKALESDKRYLEETRQLAEALRQRVMEREREKKTEISDKSTSDRVQEMLKKSQTLSDDYKQQMESFIEEHLAFADDDQSTSQDGLHQTTLTGAMIKKNPTLHQLLKKLLERSLGSPHNPYVSLEGVDPNHILFLSRVGVVETHPSRHTLIKLTPYHH